MLHILLVVEGTFPNWKFLLLLALLLSESDWVLLVWVHEITSELSDWNWVNKHNLSRSDKSAAGDTSCKQLRQHIFFV
jgi:hypothetical protein